MRQYAALLKYCLLLAAFLTLPHEIRSDPPGARSYVFPIRTDHVHRLTWTREHWDGGNGVDIYFEHGTDLQDPDFQTFLSSEVVAVSDGRVRRFDNERGGKSVLLEADSGYRFYYAHMSEVLVDSGSRVQSGEPIGIIGNTGRWTQYIEPHLHFEISSPSGPTAIFNSDVHAATWLYDTFGLGPEPARTVDHPPSAPRGSPIRVETRVLETYAEARRRSPDTASLQLEVRTDGPVPVYAPMIGEIRVHRSPFFGMRVQITNRPLDKTVVISGFQHIEVRPWQVVYRGEIVGYAAREVNIMYFREGVLTDPHEFF